MPAVVNSSSEPQLSNSASHDAALWIVRSLRDAGHIAYFAGGCVRDELLGLEPQDYDIATDATPTRIADLFPRSNQVGAAFGVMLVSRAGSIVEVATFRADGLYSDKRRPDTVTFSDPVADAQRRDFTVNALFMDPLSPGGEVAPGIRASGAVIDHVGGAADLQARVLRAVGDPDKRLEEDHLRALRAARLAAKLGFTIDPGTAAAIRRHASQLAGVSRERVGQELQKMLAHPQRARATSLIVELGMDLPILGPAFGPVTPREIATGILGSLPPGAAYTTALAAWALERGLPESAPAIAAAAASWRDSLCLSNDHKSLFEATLRDFAMLRGTWAGLGVAPQKRAAVAPGFGPALEILTARDPAAAQAVQARLRQLAQTPSGLAPAPLITGEDLIAAGLSPGPRFKSILARVYDAQLEDQARTPAEALALAKALAAQA